MIVKIAALAQYNAPHFLIHMALHIQKKQGGDLVSILKERYGVEIDDKTLAKITKRMETQSVV